MEAKLEVVRQIIQSNCDVVTLLVSIMEVMLLE